MPKHQFTSTTLTKHYASLNHAPKPEKVEKSVNELIQESRARSQTAAAASAAAAATAAADVSIPSMMSEHNPVQEAPRRRTFAGPPPPPTWLAQERKRVSARTGELKACLARFSNELQNLPATCSVQELLPRQRSLLHWCLVSIVREWQTNVVYLQHYLPDLSPAMKMVLVAYLGKYSPSGVGLHGLKLLFDETDEENERITALDLSHQIDDRNLSLVALTRFLAPKHGTDSWLVTPPSRPFPYLSSLSLSHATSSSPTKLWTNLLLLLKSLGTLTALSLANWPIPPDMFYSDRAQIYPSHACTTIRSLSKSSLSLKWIDFSFCTWVDEKVMESADWNGAWRNMQTLVLRGIDRDVCDRIARVVGNAEIALK